MKHKISIIFSVFVTLFFSCNNKKENQDIITITIDIEKNTSINLNEFISEIEIIPLETNDSSMLSSFIKLHQYGDTTFIYDTKQVSMFSFTSKGKYITKSRHLFGPGPQELNYIEDVSINPFTNEIDFMSPFGTILISDKDFKYKKKIKYLREDKITNSFKAISEDTYIFRTGDSDEYWVYSKSEDKIINRIKVPFPITRGSLSGGQLNFHYYNNSLYYTPNYFHNTMYKINDKEVLPAWKFDFGELNNIPEDDKSSRYPIYAENHPEKVYPFFKKEIDNGFISLLLYQKKLYIATHSRKSNKTKVFDTKFKDGSTIYGFQDVDNEHIYQLVSPQNIRTIFGKNNPLIKDYKELIDSISEEDNYILIKYTINKQFWDN